MVPPYNARSLTALLLLAMSLTVPVGCGDGRPPRVRVTGTVTYRGWPVKGAHVVFTPPNARPAAARTDAQGRFTLRTFDPEDGAVLGTHQITISKMNSVNPDDPYAARKSSLPERYRRADTSGLTAEVTADGENDFTFELED